MATSFSIIDPIDRDTLTVDVIDAGYSCAISRLKRAIKKGGPVPIGASGDYESVVAPVITTREGVIEIHPSSELLSLVRFSEL